MRNDNPYLPHEVAQHLSQEFGSGSVFIDIDSIPIGYDFGEYIRTSLAEVDAVLVMIGPGWQVDRLREPNNFVRLEMLVAHQLGKLIVPVLHSGARMPQRHDLPDDLAWFSSRQAFQMTSPKTKDEDLARLVSDLNKSGARRLPLQLSQQQPVSTGNDSARSQPDVGVDSPAGGLGPVLVIGCGGTGVKVLLELRKKLSRRLLDVGWSGDFPQAWQLIAVDVESLGSQQRLMSQSSGALPDFDVSHRAAVQRMPDQDFVRLALSNDAYEWVDHAVADDFARQGRTSELEGWRPAPGAFVGPVRQGAGAVRGVGRMVGLTATRRFAARVRLALDHFAQGERSLHEIGRLSGAVGGSAPVRVVLVSSLSGGTGSGVLLDVFDVVASAAPGLASIDVVVVPGVPSGSPNAESFALNALASLSELMSRAARRDLPTLNLLVPGITLGSGLENERQHLVDFLVTIFLSPRRPQLQSPGPPVAPGHGALELADRLTKASGTMAFDLGAAGFADYCRKRLIAEASSALVGRTDQGSSGRPEDEQVVEKLLEGLRAALGVSPQPESSWRQRRTPVAVVPFEGSVEAMLGRWRENTAVRSMAWFTKFRPAENEITIRLDQELDSLRRELLVVVETEVTRYASNISDLITSIVRNSIGSFPLRNLERLIIRVARDAEELAGRVEVDAREYEWRRIHERDSAMKVLSETGDRVSSANNPWDVRRLEELLESSAWNFARQLLCDRTAEILRGVCVEVLRPMASHLRRVAGSATRSTSPVDASSALESSGWQDPQEALLTAIMSTRGRQRGQSAKEVTDEGPLTHLVIPRAEWQGLYEEMVATSTAKVTGSQVERVDALRSHSGPTPSTSALRLIQRLNIGEFGTWKPGSTVRFERVDATMLEKAANDALRTVESPLAVLFTDAPIDRKLAALVSPRQRDSLELRVDAFRNLWRAAKSSGGAEWNELMPSVVLLMGQQHAPASPSESWVVALRADDGGTVEVMTACERSWTEMPELGWWIAGSLQPDRVSAASERGKWWLSRVRPLTEFLPIRPDQLRNLVRGWIVGRLLGNIPERGASGAWHIVLDDGRVVRFPDQVLQRNQVDALWPERLLSLLEHLPLAQSGALGAGALAAFDELCRLGGEAVSRFQLWIEHQPSADSTRKAPLGGDTPSDRLSNLRTALELMAEHVRLPDERPDQPYGTIEYDLLASVVSEVLHALPTTP